MTVVLTVAEIVVPVFLLAGLGLASVKLGYEYRVGFVTQLAISLFILPLILVFAIGKAKFAVCASRSLR